MEICEPRTCRISRSVRRHQILAVEQNLAADNLPGGLIRRRIDIAVDALAAAALSDKAQSFALLDAEGNVIDSLDSRRLEKEMRPEISNFKNDSSNSRDQASRYSP